MDQKSIEAVHTVAQMEQEHFAGGYYSPDVHSEFDRIKGVDGATKQELYADAFNEAYTLVQDLQSHPRYVKGKADETWSYVDGRRVNHDSKRGVIDLSDEGLGEITIATTEGPQDKDTGLPLYRDLQVRVDSFSPDPKFYIDEEDELRKLPRIKGLVYTQKHPKGWNARWLLHSDGPPFKAEDPEAQDLALLGILDYVETLRVVSSIISPSETHDAEEASA